MMRDPNKRRVKPVEQACVLDLDDEESSDDSDFRIEDHPEQSDDYDDDDEDEEAIGGDSSDAESNVSGDLNNDTQTHTIADILNKADQHLHTNNSNPVMICCGCLGDHSDGTNEIVECDSCGVTVHEACYGVSDTASLMSTDSVSPTAPWFCESCRAGVKEPICELCPNSGGIFKETDVGKWVHLICALYVPGVAFGEVDKLTSVTLFEMQYSKWGAKTCSLCTDDRFARTGVCIGCDAGMCRTYFHVTCAQREGFLSEAHSEEVDQADPFYAHCKLHSDKTLVRKRRRNFMALQMRHINSQTDRIQRELSKQTYGYLAHKSLKPPPWVPTQKMPRLLTTSASAVRKLMLKAQKMGINTHALETQEAHALALVDVRKKWHISPAFTVEFIAYYLDRNDRLADMKKSLEGLLANNGRLLAEQQELRARYDELLKQVELGKQTNLQVKQDIFKLHSVILSACPTKPLPDLELLSKPAPATLVVPTAAALKMGVGFPISNQCGICGQRRDQHLLAKCDTCHLYYHLNCLNPPLTRLPKKSKLYGWQCSECGDKTSDSEREKINAPRRQLKIKPMFSRELHVVLEKKKRRRDKRPPAKEHKRKRKKKCLDIEDAPPHPRITIKIKPIPLPAGEVASESNPQRFYVPNDEEDPPPPLPPPVKGCHVCRVQGTSNDSVRCDDCEKIYHFACLEPPLKKSPKKRGYSWHCADCDPTGSE